MEHSGRKKGLHEMKTIFDLFTHAFEIEEILQLLMIGSTKVERVLSMFFNLKLLISLINFNHNEMNQLLFPLHDLFENPKPISLS